MGYAASVTRMSFVGTEDQELVLQPARIKTVYHHLYAAQHNGGGRYEGGDRTQSWISWCEPMDKYMEANDGKWDQTVVDVLNDYGWECTELRDDGSIEVGYWRGDKLGSSWDDVLKGIALGIDPDITVEIIMTGEDGDMWGHRLHNGNVTSHNVRLEII